MRLDPNLVPALRLKGKMAIGLNQFPVARQCFERAAEPEADSAYTQFILGSEFAEAAGAPGNE